jgi:hypothetical protein
MEEEKVSVHIVKEPDKDILVDWKRLQPLPPDAETLEMGKIAVKSMAGGELLFWKVKRQSKEEFALILAVHNFEPNTILPVALQQFGNEVALHLFVNSLKQKAMSEWMNPWWKGGEGE